MDRRLEAFVVIGDRGLVVAPADGAVRGMLFSSLLGRTKVERIESARSVDELLSAFPADATITALLPGHLVMVRRVSFPFTSAEMQRRTLPFEMEGLVPLPVDELLVDSVPAPATDSGSSVMALAVPKTIVTEALAAFPEHRKPERVIPDFVSLLALGRTVHGKDDVYAVLRVDDDVTSLAVVARECVVALRSLDGRPEPSAVAAWVEATLSPLDREGQAPETLYVTGSAGALAVTPLGRLAPVIAIPPTVRGISRREWPAWSTLAGAALAASAFPRFNLIGMHAGHARTGRIVRRLAVGGGVLLLLGTANLSVHYATESRTLDALKASSRRAFAAAMPHARHIVKEDAQLRTALVAAQQTRDALIGKPSPSYLEVSRGLARLAAGHPELKLREAVMEGSVVIVAGDGRSVGADALKAVFTALEGARAVQVQELAQGVERDTVRFRVSVEVR